MKVIVAHEQGVPWGTLGEINVARRQGVPRPIPATLFQRRVPRYLACWIRVLGERGTAGFAGMPLRLVTTGLCESRSRGMGMLRP